MVGPEHSEPEEDFDAEVSDLRRVAQTPPPPRQVSFSTKGQRPPVGKLTRLAVTLALVALALLVLVASLPALRERALGLLPGRTAPPAATSSGSADDLFFLLPNPPGVDVSLDGRVLAQPPAPGDPHPLRLAAGHHTLAWASHDLPFQPLTCRISVPHSATDTCPKVSPLLLPRALSTQPSAVIGMHAGLGSLGPEDARQLVSAIRAALDAKRSTATVQAGERYFVIQPDQGGEAVVARQPLRATLSYQFVPDAGYLEPCNLTEPAIPCRFPGQDCSQLCTVTQPPAAVAGASGSWVAAAMVNASWDYATPDGQIVAQGVGEAFGIQLLPLRITHDALGWHVAPIVGHMPGFDVADDAACDPARFAIWQTPSWRFMMETPPPGARVQFASDGTPSDGCVAVLTHGEPAVFLQRFGVLLTVNDAARNPTDNLPAANPDEQARAQRLLTLLGD